MEVLKEGRKEDSEVLKEGRKIQKFLRKGGILEFLWKEGRFRKKGRKKEDCEVLYERRKIWKFNKLDLRQICLWDPSFML